MTDDREQAGLDAEWERIARYLAGESSPEESRRLRDELARDPERAALLDALDAALAPPADTPLSDREVDAALASVMARRDQPAAAALEPDPRVVPLRRRPSVGISLLRSQWRRAGLRAAAAVVVVASGAMLWRATRPDERATAGPVAAAASRVYETAPREIDTLKLADGSTVVLGPSSRLALGASFGTRTRETTLEGLAYFDVVHDDARPFVVRTPSATLRDIGTTFTVRSDSVHGTRVAVSSGAVDVAVAAAGTVSPTVLHAGDRAVVTGESMRVERGAAIETELSWTRGVLELRDAPLSLVAVELRRWYGVKLVVTDSTIASRRVTATFERASVDDVGRVLAAVVGGSVSRAGDTLRLGAAAGR